MHIVSEFYLVLKNFIKKVNKYLTRYPLVEFAFLSIIIVYFSEILNQRSLVNATKFMVLSFPVAILNVLIVFSLFCVTLLLRKKLFWKYFIMAFWTVISVVSFIMYSMRMMPFSFMDILLLPGTFTVFPVYLSVWQMILAGAFLLGLMAFIVYIYRKTTPAQVDYKKSCVTVVLAVVFTGLYLIICKESGFVDNRITGLTGKYRTNGFVYCFSSSIADMGMNEPSEYSDSKIADVMSEIEGYNADEKINSNIIFVQLESFFDINSVKHITLSENPIPVFTKLKKEYSHGNLRVPTYSAGTANTEFEILTGMNIDYFGIGEFPFQTVAEKQTIESVAHIMSENGYKNHALHNNSAKFYNRDIVYANLGFDTFTSLEYMYDVKYNQMGWAKDTVLVSGISDAIKSTKERDFVYAVSVQTHGVYPDTPFEKDYPIKVSGLENEKLKNQYEYYVNELKGTDAFIGALISELDTISEPTTVVFFGDHLPGIEPEYGVEESGDIYKTEYVMWSNFKSDCIIKDIESYQLYSYVLDRLNITGGAIQKLHRRYAYSENEEYNDNFEILQYHMLYNDSDDKNIENTKGFKTYEPSELKLGVRKIKITDVNFVADVMFVHGDNFNEFSKVFCDDKKLETLYVDSHTLQVTDEINEDAQMIKVGQVDSNSNVLSHTDEFKLKNKPEL